jgi:ribosomal protein L1
LFSEDKLKENLVAVFNSIEKNKPTVLSYFKSFNICTTMSPESVELGSFKKKKFEIVELFC